MTFSKVRRLFARRCPNICVASPEALEGRCGAFRFTEPWGIADKVEEEIEKTKKVRLNLGKQAGEGSEEGGAAQASPSFLPAQTPGVGRTHSILGGIAQERPKDQEFGFPLGFWMGLQGFQGLDVGRR